MMTITLGSRALVILGLDAFAQAGTAMPFAALVPAYDENERHQGETLVGSLVDRGCVELCCVGPEAEQLHDALDTILEARGFLDVVTTWDVDHVDACEYFLFAAAGASAALVALVAAHPDVVATLVNTARTAAER